MTTFSRYSSMFFQGIALIIAFALLEGCTGRVYTVVKPEAAAIYKGKNAYEGVLFYLPSHFLEISWTTAILKDGKVTHSATASGDKQCIQDIRVKEVVRADFSEPYQLVYDPGFLEKYTFKVEFDQGILKSVNAESSPDRGETLKNLASTAKDAASIAGVLFIPIGGTPCTDLPELKYIKKVSEICRDGTCDLKKYTPKKDSQ